MSKFEDVFNWLKTCPYLANLWAISADLQAWNDVLFWSSSTDLYKYVPRKYVDGKIQISMIPTEDYSETFTINAYRPFAENADTFNIDAFNQTQKVCDWIIEQQNEAVLPTIDGRSVYAVELLTPSPSIRGYDVSNDTYSGKVLGYFISFRIHMNNPAKRVDYFV